MEGEGATSLLSSSTLSFQIETHQAGSQVSSQVNAFCISHESDGITQRAGIWIKGDGWDSVRFLGRISAWPSWWNQRSTSSSFLFLCLLGLQLQADNNLTFNPYNPCTHFQLSPKPPLHPLAAFLSVFSRPFLAISTSFSITFTSSTYSLDLKPTSSLPSKCLEKVSLSHPQYLPSRSSLPLILSWTSLPPLPPLLNPSGWLFLFAVLLAACLLFTMVFYVSPRELFSKKVSNLNISVEFILADLPFSSSSSLPFLLWKPLWYQLMKSLTPQIFSRRILNLSL